MYLLVHGLNEQSGIAAVVLAFTADGTLIDGVGEESVAFEAVVVGERTNHWVVGQAKLGFIAISIHGLLNHVIRLVTHAVRAARAFIALASGPFRSLVYLGDSVLQIEVRVGMERGLAWYWRRARIRTDRWCSCWKKWSELERSEFRRT